VFDTHYDLLTLAYMAQKEKININHLLKPLNQKNISGVIANLYFMSEKEMKEELKYPNNINVLDMFKQAKENLNSYNLNCKILYSIEGCDYIKDTDELQKLKEAGLDSILLVWNTNNKYGSGNYSTKGLTEEGKHFIKQAINLELGIDLSHANEKTFDGIIEEIKIAQNSGKKVICYASHSNIRSLHNHQRNLSDRQLELLKEVGGKLGLVAYKDFLTDNQDIKDKRKAYIKHILYAVNKLGIDNIMLASDNMYFINLFKTYEEDKPIYMYNKMKEEIKEDLSKYFIEEDINKIMYDNAENLYKKLKKIT